LNGRILSGRIETHRLVETELTELRHSLSELGYQVDALTSDLLSPSPLNPQPSTLNAIDVSA